MDHLAGKRGVKNKGLLYDKSKTFTTKPPGDSNPGHLGHPNRKLRLRQAMSAIRAYEVQLTRALLDILEETPGVMINGLRDIDRLEQRVPTFAFNLEGFTPRQVAEELGKRNIYVWDGN